MLESSVSGSMITEKIVRVLITSLRRCELSESVVALSESTTSFASSRMS